MEGFVVDVKRVVWLLKSTSFPSCPSWLQGMTEILKMQGIVDQNECRLLVASIRSAQEVGELAAQGANTFTVSPQVAEELVMDPLTAAAAELFEEHAAEMGALHDR